MLHGRWIASILLLSALAIAAGDAKPDVPLHKLMDVMNLVFALTALFRVTVDIYWWW